MSDEKKPFRWHGTMAEFDAEVRRRWIESSERLGLDTGMPNTEAAIAAQQPQPAPEPSSLGLKHAVTSSRLGCALAALREIAGPRSDEFPRDTARNALADDAAIRDGVALTREPKHAPELAAAMGALAGEWDAEADVSHGGYADGLRSCADGLRKRAGLDPQ